MSSARDPLLRWLDADDAGLVSPFASPASTLLMTSPQEESPLPIGARFPEVLSAAADGADWAWAELYQDLAGSVLSFLRSQAAPDPEDLLGECFVHLVRGIPRFEGSEADFRAWVFTIARSRLRDAWRAAGRRPSVPVADLTDLRDAASAEAADATFLGRVSVEAVLDRLNADQRMVLVLRVVYGFPLRDTAQIMGRTEGSVKLLQHRALVTLRRILTDEPAMLWLVGEGPD